MANSYIEKSQFISKFYYDNNKDKYSDYEKYMLEDKVIISKNESQFVSIYDIAFYCKKKYKNHKLFLIAHRFIDTNTNDKVVEFFLFNTKNIFDKALTSYISIKYEELFEKRHLVQEMINIAKTLLNTKELFVILGDNVKQHDILEYLNLDLEEIKEENEHNEDGEEKEKKVDLLKLNINSKNKNLVQFARISNILTKVRILEPKEKKNKKLLYIVVALVVSFLFVPDFIKMGLSDYKNDIQKSIKNDKRLLKKIKRDVFLKIKDNVSLKKEKEKFSKKDIFKVGKK